MKNFFLTFWFSSSFLLVIAQSEKITFAHVSDTHIGSSTAAEDLSRTVKDINENRLIQFVILSGDITEFGSDEEIALAKKILDSLDKPWYIVPGNHDGGWSESGANTFKKVFGSETFYFTKNGFAFVGTHCGPNMRMGPGQIPRENIVWLDSVLKTIPNTTPIVFVNHYPQDESLNNWFEALDRLKQKNIQLILCGHGHANRKLNFEGIPAIMGRSNLRAKADIGGYNIATIQNNTVSYAVRIPGKETKDPWLTIELNNYSPDPDKTYLRPSYAMNDSFSVKEIWSFQDHSDIGSGSASGKNIFFTTNTSGELVALKKNGKPAWKYKTGGKIYSIPAVKNGVVVISSSDHFIYGLSEETGKVHWKFETGKAVLGHPVINGNTVYVGGSDSTFRAISLATGRLKWEFTQVAGFIVTKPLIYSNKIYFGCWNNDFYCLDLNDGSLVWKWNNGSTNRMFSPAACFPVGAHNKIFIVAPDRFMTSLDANTGAVVWRKQLPELRVRESMGLAFDSSMIYVKTMQGQVHGISTTANDMQSIWKSDVELGYEICPTAIVENKNVVFIPTQSGVTVAVDRNSGKQLWKYKTSNCLITHLLPVSKNQLLVTTMDGRVSLLKY